MAKFSFKNSISNVLKVFAGSSIRSTTNPTSNRQADLFQGGMMFINKAKWIQTQSIKEYLDIYETNPVFQSAVNIVSKAESNVRIRVWNKVKEEYEPESTTARIPQKIYKLFKNPNPTQSGREWYRQKSIFYNVAGNAFIHGNLPDNFKNKGMDIMSVQTLTNPWPQYMGYKLSGGYFSALEISDVIEQWVFDSPIWKKEWDPHEILLQNNPNVNLFSPSGPLSGTSVIEGLRRPLTNVMKALEARNVVMDNMGMAGMISSNKGDAISKVPLMPDEKAELEERMKNYGNLEDQMRWFFTTSPVKVDMFDQDVRKLGLFEEVVSDGLLISSGVNVPNDLVKLDVDGITYENQTASLRILYENNVIPRVNDDMQGMTSWLNLDDTDWEIHGKFDHLAIFKEDEVNASKAKLTTSKVSESLFMRGQITGNQWMVSVGFPENPNGSKFIWEYSPDELAVILNKPKTAGDGTG